MIVPLFPPSSSDFNYQHLPPPLQASANAEGPCVADTPRLWQHQSSVQKRNIRLKLNRNNIVAQQAKSAKVSFHPATANLAPV